MKTILIERSAPDAVPLLSEILRRGGFGVLPCDTIYGFSALADENGALKIFDVKRRPQNKNLIMLLDKEQAEQSSFIVPPEVLECWPAPLTAIVKRSDGSTQAIRVPQDEFALSLISLSGPIWSTSVNISGEPALLRADEIIARFEGECDFIVRKEEESSSALPSTIIDCTRSPFRILRQGAYDASHLIRLASI